MVYWLPLTFDYLANSSILLGKLGAYHLIRIKKCLPNTFALIAELHLLCGFL